jgi:transcriptional regulator NrdR family protein
MSAPAQQQDQHCRVCHNEESLVVECRGTRRRRECTRCRHRWTTYEISAERLEQLEKLEEHATAIAGVLNASG